MIIQISHFALVWKPSVFAMICDCDRVVEPASDTMEGGNLDAPPPSPISGFLVHELHWASKLKRNLSLL